MLCLLLSNLNLILTCADKAVQSTLPAEKTGGSLIHMHSLFQPKPIKISQKTGIPLHVLPQKGLTAKQIERMQMINDSDLPRASTQPRSKNESKEERKARKQAIKEERKVCPILNEPYENVLYLLNSVSQTLNPLCFFVQKLMGKISWSEGLISASSQKKIKKRKKKIRWQNYNNSFLIYYMKVWGLLLWPLFCR